MYTIREISLFNLQVRELGSRSGTIQFLNLYMNVALTTHHNIAAVIFPQSSGQAMHSDQAFTLELSLYKN